MGWRIDTPIIREPSRLFPCDAPARTVQPSSAHPTSEQKGNLPKRGANMKLNGIRSLSCICLFLLACSSATRPGDPVEERPDPRETGVVGTSWMLELSQGGFARCYDAALVNEDTYVLVGDGTNSEFGDLGIWTLAVNVDGEVLWQQLLGSGEAHGVAPSGDGGAVVAGFVNSDGSSDLDLVVLRLGPEGDLLWRTRVGGSGSESGGRIVQGVDGGFMVLGTMESSETQGRDLWIVGLDGEGHVTDQRIIQAPGDQYATDLVAVDGSYYAASSNLLVKVAADGSTEWARTFQADLGIRLGALAEGEDGGVVVAGALAGDTEGQWANDEDVWLASLDGGGEILWQRVYGGQLIEQSAAVTRTLDGDLVVAAGTLSFGRNSSWIFRVDASNGDLLWEETVQGNDYPSAVVEAAGGMLLITGQSMGYGDEGPTMMMAHLNATGEVEGEACGLVVPTDAETSDVEAELNRASVETRLTNAEEHSDSSSSSAWNATASFTCPHATVDLPGGDVVEGGEPDERSWALKFGAEHSGFTRANAAPYPDGDVAIVASQIGSGDEHLWAARLSPEGELRWQRRLQCQGAHDVPNEVALTTTSDGGLVVATAGEDHEHGGGSPAICLSELDASGDHRWSRLYRTEPTEPLIDLNVYFTPVSVAELADGGLVISATADNGNDVSMRLLRTSPTGELLWHRAIEPTQEAYNAIGTSTGGILALGRTERHGTLVTSLDADGEVLWSVTLDEVALDAVDETPEGGFVLAGATAYHPNRGWMVVLDNEGEVERAVTMDGPIESTWPTSVVVLDDASIIIAGRTATSQRGDFRIWFARFTAAGETLWQRTLGEESSITGAALVTNDHLVVVGNARSDVMAASLSLDGVMSSGCSSLLSWDVAPESHDISEDFSRTSPEVTEIVLDEESTTTSSSTIDVGVEEICAG